MKTGSTRPARTVGTRRPAASRALPASGLKALQAAARARISWSSGGSPKAAATRSAFKSSKAAISLSTWHCSCSLQWQAMSLPSSRGKASNKPDLPPRSLAKSSTACLRETPRPILCGLPQMDGSRPSWSEPRPAYKVFPPRTCSGSSSTRRGMDHALASSVTKPAAFNLPANFLSMSSRKGDWYSTTANLSPE